MWYVQTIMPSTGKIVNTTSFEDYAEALSLSESNKKVFTYPFRSNGSCKTCGTPTHYDTSLFSHGCDDCRQY